MKIVFIIAIVAFMASCGSNQGNRTPLAQNPTPEGTYGEIASSENAINAETLPDLLSDTHQVHTIVEGQVIQVCQHSGCWLDIIINDSVNLRVSFSDPKLTIPKNSKGKTAIVSGIAEKELISVETLRNFAREDGMSEEEAAKINQPVYQYSFEATGIMLR